MNEPNFTNQALQPQALKENQQKRQNKSKTKISYKVFENGDLYVGRIKRGKLHGKGLIFFDGPHIRCEGMWLNNLLNGIGRQTGPESERYVGEFLEGLKSGKGKYMNDTQVIIGEFVEGELSGFGVNTDFNKGLICKGNFERGKLQKFGTIDSLDAQYSFAGNFLDGVYQGLGEESIRDSHYMGYFENGLKNGIGAYRDFKNYRYVGYWVKGNKHGFGIEKDSEGNIFEGSFRENHKMGFCRKYSPKSGITFTGKVKNSGKTGFGKLETPYLLYFGDWSGNKRNGLGYEAYADGRIYFGNWEKNKKKGYGVEWKGDLFFYKGEWDDDKPHGYAVFQNYKGEEKCGVFEEGRLKELTKKIPKALYEYIEKQKVEEFLEECQRKLGAVESKVNSRRAQMEKEHFDFRSKITFERNKLQMRSRDLFISVERLEARVMCILGELEEGLVEINLDMKRLMGSYGYDIEEEVKRDVSILNDLNQSMEKSSFLLDQTLDEEFEERVVYPDSKYILPGEEETRRVNQRNRAVINRFFKESFISHENSPMTSKDVSYFGSPNPETQLVPASPIVTQMEKILKWSRLNDGGMKKEIPKGSMSKKKWRKKKKDGVAVLKNIMQEDIIQDLRRTPPSEKKIVNKTSERKKKKTFLDQSESFKKDEILNILKDLDNDKKEMKMSKKKYKKIRNEYKSYKEDKLRKTPERNLSPNTDTVKGGKSPRMIEESEEEDEKSTPKKLIPLKSGPQLAKREINASRTILQNNKLIKPIYDKNDITISTVVSPFKGNNFDEEEVWNIFTQDPEIKKFELPTDKGDSSSKIIKIKDSNKYILTSLYHITGFKVDEKTGRVKFTFEKKFNSDILDIKQIDGERLMVLTQDNLEVKFLDKDKVVYNSYKINSMGAGPPKINLGYTNKISLKVYSLNSNSFLSFNRHGDIALVNIDNFKETLRGNFLDERDRMVYDLISIIASEERKTAYILLKTKAEEEPSTSILNSINFTTGQKNSFDLKDISHNLISAVCLELTNSQDTLVYGSVNSHTPTEDQNYENMYPSINAVKIEKDEIILESALDIQELADGIGIFTMNRVKDSDVLICTSNKSLIVAQYKEEKFNKIKIIDFLDDIVYSASIDGLNFHGFSQKYEALVVSKFDLNKVNLPSKAIYETNSVKERSFDRKEEIITRVKKIKNNPEGSGLREISKFKIEKNFKNFFCFGNGCFNKCKITENQEISIIKSTLPFDAFHFELYEHNDKIILCENITNNLLVVDYDLTFLKKIEGEKTYPVSPLTEIKHYGLDEDVFLWLKGNHYIVLMNVILMRQINAFPLFAKTEQKIKNKKFQPVKVLVNEFKGKRKYFAEYTIDGDIFISLKFGEKSVKYFELTEKIPDVKIIYSVECTKDGRYLIILANSHKNIYKGEKIILVLDFNLRLKLLDRQLLSVKIADFLPKIQRVESKKKEDLFIVNLSDCFCVYEITDDGKVILNEMVMDSLKCARRDFDVQKKRVFRVEESMDLITESRI